MDRFCQEASRAVPLERNYPGRLENQTNPSPEQLEVGQCYWHLGRREGRRDFEEVPSRDLIGGIPRVSVGRKLSSR